MEETRFSILLDELLDVAATLYDYSTDWLTAEKFICACINKLSEVAPESRTEELEGMYMLLNEHFFGGLYEARSIMRHNIESSSSWHFDNPVVVSNILTAAVNFAEAEGKDEVDAVDVLKQALTLPTIQVERTIEKLRKRYESGCVFLPFPGDPGSDHFDLYRIFDDDEECYDFPSEDDEDDTKRQNSLEEMYRLIDNLFSDDNDTESVSDTESNNYFDDSCFNSPKTGLAKLVEEVKFIRTELKKSVFGQDNAINVFISGYFQSRLLAMTDDSRRRPAATFLFAGPPGVGKTFMAEKISDCLGLPFKRFDMSEYADDKSYIDLCGWPKSYKDAKPGVLTGFVSSNPKCVLIFDEIEKAHLNVIHLFLQMLDAGRVRDNYEEEEISFRDALVIFTTNAGKQIYEDSENINLSAISRKVIIKALEQDVNPKTQNPYFPKAMCSRFASGNVVMFNHIGAHDLCTIVEGEIKRNATNFEKRFDIGVDVDEKVYSALMFSEGASVDARTIRGRAECFFNDEIYELLRLVTTEKSIAEIEDISWINIVVDLERATPEIVSFFDSPEKAKILVLSKSENVDLISRMAPKADYYGAHSCDEVVEIIKNNNIDIIMLDVRFGANLDEYLGLNIEDAYTPARECLNYLHDTNSDLPIYILEDNDTLYTEEEKISFTNKGVRDVIKLSEDHPEIADTIALLSAMIHRQKSMKALARQNKLIAFSTAQKVDRDGVAEIRLFDFRMEVAIEAEDSKNILSSLSKPNVKFDNIIGAADAKRELSEFINYLKNPKKYVGTGLRSPKGVLLYGPPGTGKTMLAKAMAAEADMTFIAAEGNQFLKTYVGEGPDMVHKLFKTARKYAPAVIFVDEIEVIAKDRTGGEQAGVRGEDVLAAFLTEMDGFSTDPTKPVFVIAATNFEVEPGRPKSLDGAILRRFDRKIFIGLPGKADRIKFFNMKREQLAALQISDAVIESLAVRSTGMSLSSLDSVIDFSLRIAIREGKKTVTDEVIEEAFETFNYGEAKKWGVSELERTARHEAGHALLCYLSGETPSYLTIVARGKHGGYMQHGDNEGKGIYTREELLARIRTSLGGRAAEIVCYGEKDGVSTGASADLASATATAMYIVCSCGMDDEFGLAVFDGSPTPEVRAAVNKILREQMAESIRLVSDNRHKLDALVDELISKSSLNARDIERILAD